jgi:hypothetical protein
VVFVLPFVLLVFLVAVAAIVTTVNEHTSGERRLEGDKHRKCYE